MKILILDDDPFVLKLLSIQLKAFGLKGRGYMDQVQCERGDLAVSVLEAAPGEVGLIFCDLQMPEMDGVEFFRHLVRLQYRGVLVLMSGESERVVKAAERLALSHGLRVVGALQKPIFPEQLRRVLDDAIPAITPAGGDQARRYGPDELRHALAEGRLVNHYQPKIDLVSGAVVGAEALARWQHPDGGVLMPGQFIEMAEEYGLMMEMSEAVLRGALQQARRWHDAGHPLHVSVNLTMADLSSLQFPDFVASQADAAGVPPSSLVVEIAENQVISDARAQLDVLTRLRLKGVRLSIDDFGTGHSNLAQLRDMPFDELKIDSGFVNGASVDSHLRAIVEASVAMARQMGMTTVAKGVELQVDLDLVGSVGCDMAQGYLVARPMAGDDVMDWIATREAGRAVVEPVEQETPQS